MTELKQQRGSKETNGDRSIANNHEQTMKTKADKGQETGRGRKRQKEAERDLPLK